MHSIRNFLVVVLLSIICLVNFLAALHGYRSSLREADALLLRQLEDIAEFLADVQPGSQQPQIEAQSRTFWFQVWSQEGELLARSANAPESQLLPRQERLHQLSFAGFSWQVLIHRTVNNSEREVWVTVAERADVYSDLTEKMIMESILPVIWVLPILGVLIGLVVSFGLRPLKKLAYLLSHRQPGNFTRLPVTGYPIELSVLVQSTNELLDGLAGAFARERRFSADAAHELRTPLAALKVNLHNLQQQPQLTDSEDLKAMVSSVGRMAHSIEQLLALYRSSPGLFSQSSEQLDVAAMAREAIAECYPFCQQKQQNIELCAGPVNLQSEPVALQTLLRNLIDNACKYTPAGGEIRLSVSATGGVSAQSMRGVRIQVEDSGPGIPEDAYERVFDRFYRLGGDQHTSGAFGSGLGLSIVEHIARLHQGTVSLSRSAALGGLCVTVYLYEGASRHG